MLSSGSEQLSTDNQRPVRNTLLHFARPDITPEEIAAVSRVLESGWLTSGPEVAAFETEFAAAVGARYAVAVNSATAALHLAMLSWEIGPEDAVIVPAITFTATAEVVAYGGGLPLIIDVNRDDYLLDPDLLKRFINEKCVVQNRELIHKPSGRRVRALIPVHIGGRPCRLNELQEIANRYRLKIVEDAAHAFPGRYNDQIIGSISELTAFSFYVTKNLCTGEGGMLTTNSEALAEHLKKIRLHGIQGQTYGRQRWHYDVVELGYKYNMSDINAALGRVQLRRSDAMLKQRKKIAALYREKLGKVRGLRLTPPSPHDDSHHLFTAEITTEAKVSRDQFVEELYARNIAVSLHFIPLYRLSYYARTYKLKPEDFPNSEAIFLGLFSLPLYSKMEEQEVEDVIAAVREILE